MTTDFDPHAGAARRLFEQTVADMDPATANRLRLMRRETLASARAPRRWQLPAAAFASLALILALGWRVTHAPAPVDSSAVLVTEPDLPLAADEETALYAWLGEAPVAADGEAL